MNSEESDLDKFRKKWSEKLTINFWASILLSLFALLVVIVAVAIPHSLGTDHKVYIIGVVAVGLIVRNAQFFLHAKSGVRLASLPKGQKDTANIFLRKSCLRSSLIVILIFCPYGARKFIILLLWKAKSDSGSLLILTKVCDVISAFIIGITVGQLTRGVSFNTH